MSLNRYAYARDDPMKYVDPTGHYLVPADRLHGGIGTDSTPTLTAKAGVVTVMPAPPDVALGHNRNGQYASGLTMGTKPFITRQQVNAWVVTIALGTSAVDLGIIAIGFAVPLVTAPAAVAAGLGAIALVEATDETVIYDIQAGPNATPQGAYSHFVDSAGVHVVEDIANKIWAWCGGLGIC